MAARTHLRVAADEFVSQHVRLRDVVVDQAQCIGSDVARALRPLHVVRVSGCEAHRVQGVHSSISALQNCSTSAGGTFSDVFYKNLN